MIFFFQAEDGIRDLTVTGVQTCALPIHSGVDGAARRGEGGRCDRGERSLHAGLPGSPQLPAVDGTSGAAGCDAASRRTQRTAVEALKCWNVEPKYGWNIKALER